MICEISKMDWKDIKSLFANTPKNPLVWGDDMNDSDDENDDDESGKHNYNYLLGLV